MDQVDDSKGARYFAGELFWELAQQEVPHAGFEGIQREEIEVLTFHPPDYLRVRVRGNVYDVRLSWTQTLPTIQKVTEGPVDICNTITRDEDILGGTAVFSGTRVPVKTLFDYLKANHPLDDFLDDFPTVPRQHAQQVIEMAQEHMQESAYEIAA